MGKMEGYFVEHPTYNSLIHVSVGLGIAWLLSLIWHCSLISLVLGIVFFVVSLAGRFYAQFAKQ